MGVERVLKSVQRKSEAQKKGKEREMGRRRTRGNVACCGGDWRPSPSTLL